MQALQLIRSQRCAWPVIASEDEEVSVRAIQLVDACRRFLGLTPEAIAAAGVGRVNNRWLASVLKASSALADSPKETEMRLLAAKVAREFGLELEEQVEFWKNGKLVTRADLAFPGTKIALYYDGIHHDDASTRLRDTSVDLYLTSIAWRPLRYGTNMLGGLIGHVEVVLRERGFVKVNKRPKSDLGVCIWISGRSLTFASGCLWANLRSLTRPSGGTPRRRRPRTRGWGPGRCQGRR